MTKQQLRLEELAEEGRQWAKHPELKPKPRPEGRGMARAMAHLDELLEKGKLQKQAREVASPQQSDEVFHDAVDPSDNEESIWMDSNEVSPSWEMPTDIAESSDVMENELEGGEQAMDPTEIIAVPDFREGELAGGQAIDSIVAVPDFTEGQLAGEQAIDSIVAVPDFTEGELSGGQAIDSIVAVPDFREGQLAGEQAIDSIIAVPDFTEGELAGESFLAGVQQNQNPLTEVETEREDFSMWSFLRAAGLVCGCWGR